MIATRAHNLAISGLLAAAFLVAAASSAKEGDNTIVGRAEASAPKGEPENASAADERKPATPARSTIANEDTAERGTHPFVSYGCYQCHGYFGHGANSGPRLSADMPYEGFQQIVRFPYEVMPAYPRELLSDEDLRAIYSFIQNRPPAPEIKDLPLLYDTSK